MRGTQLAAIVMAAEGLPVVFRIQNYPPTRCFQNDVGFHSRNFPTMMVRCPFVHPRNSAAAMVDPITVLFASVKLPDEILEKSIHVIFAEGPERRLPGLFVDQQLLMNEPAHRQEKSVVPKIALSCTRWNACRLKRTRVVNGAGETYRGSLLGQLNRLEEAVGVWLELEDRFADINVIEVRELVALALGSLAFACKELNRPEEALAACDRLMRRYGGDKTARILEIASVELLNKAILLLQLNRLEETVAVCNEIARRYSDSDASAVVVQVANSHVLKATALDGLGRHLEAKAAWEEVIRRFGASQESKFDFAVGTAFLQTADTARKQGCFQEATMAVERLLHRTTEGVPGHQCQAHLIRAQARAAVGDASDAEQDLKAALQILPDSQDSLRRALDVLMDFAVLMGPEDTSRLVEASPSSELFMPFRVALQKEMGREPRVAREIEEVAEDIRHDIETRRRSASK